MGYPKLLAFVLSGVLLASCGGGGGSPSLPSTTPTTTTTTGGGTTTTPTVAAASISLQLRDVNGASTTTLALAGTTARATVVDASNAPVANKLVTFSTTSTLAVLSPASGQALTDAAGVAVVQLSPASLTAGGAGTLTATATVDTVTVTKTLDFQLTAASLKIEALNVGSGTLAAYGNRSISVQVTANGVPVATPVPVTFAASCGAANLAPTTVSTNASGIANTTYSAIAPECFGTNLAITASVAGAVSVSGQIPVAAAQVANIQFVSSAPQLIYLTGSTGATQAVVTFKVIDSNSNPVQNQSVQLSLMNSAPGVSLGISGSSAPVAATTNSAGQVAVAVFAGTIPTSVQVKAVIPSNLSVPATLSNILTVASGRAVQKAASLSLEKFSIEGFNLDGATSTVTMSLADRQGNPVPDGTQVNFTSESGVLVPPSCVTSGGTSSCVVNIRSQGTRPSDGRVSILAYLPGEEDFVDANANNVYDAGEAYTDLGDAYRDDNEDNAYVSTDDFTVPRASPALACQSRIPTATAPDNVLGGDHGRADRCDQVWGTADIRRQTVIVFSTSSAVAFGFNGTAPNKIRLSAPGFKVVDLNGNNPAVGSTIAIASPDTGCSVTTTQTTVLNVSFSKAATVAGNAGTPVSVTQTGCAAGNTVNVTVTSPSGIVRITPLTFE
jgi:hypothetical protein